MSELNNQSNLAKKAYWMRKLSGMSSPTSLLPDYRNLEDSRNNEECSKELSASLSHQLVRLTKNSKLSLYIALSAALKIHLSKYTGEKDIIIGSPVFQEKDSTQDFCPPLVPLRSLIDDKISFKDFLLEVRKTILEAYDHRVEGEVLTPYADISYNVISLHEGLHSINIIEKERKTLAVLSSLMEDKVKIRVLYNTFLFQPTTIQRFLDRFENILQIVVQNNNIKIGAIDFSSSEEKEIILKKFQGEKINFPIQSPLHRLFETRVKQNPKNSAVVFEEETLNYDDLNSQANQLARHLVQIGLKKGDFVGILEERNPKFLISILAILKAGGAYIPLDPAYPQERIQYMMSQSEMKTLLTSSRTAQKFEEVFANLHFKNIICEDQVSKQPDFKNLSRDNLEIDIEGEDFAYMIYTSGSTGLSKGAIIRHNGAVNHIYAQKEALELNKNLCFLQSAPSSSDISVWQFLAPLLLGGKTVIVSLDDLSNPEKLFSILNSQKISLVELVPAVLESFLEFLTSSGREKSLPYLKWMMVTGETVTVDLANRWLHHFPSIPLANAYGPTEASDDITQFLIRKPIPEKQRHVSIGKPLANVDIYILKEQGEVAPIDVVGEICVGGIAVGVGYWKNEDKTKTSFVSHPFSKNRENLIYKTGDLGRWREDGTIEFLGRKDRQVKLRGYRIELEEIEAVISRYRGLSTLKENAVILRQNQTGDQELIAYIVWQSQEEIENLKKHIKNHLPQHMVPALFVDLVRLPRTPNGKVDYKKLPEPEKGKKEKHINPRNHIEITLAKIWSEVLDIDDVSVFDDFFQRGGHSLLAVRVAIKIKNEFEIDIPLRALFEFSTLEKLAHEVARLKTLGATTQDFPLLPVSRDQNLPLSSEQERLWFLDQLEPGNPFYNIPGGIRLSGNLNIPILEKSLKEVIRRHETLRTTFPAIDGKPSQIIQEDREFFIPLDDLSFLPNHEKEKNILEKGHLEITKSFNLQSDLLIRARLLKLSSSEHILLITMHHIVSDDWSVQLLIHEMITLYRAYLEGKASPLPPLPIQYADYTFWQKTISEKSEKLKNELDYWQEKLKGIPTLLNLPTDHPRPPVQTYRGATETFVVPPEISDKIKNFSRQEGVTPFMTFLASFMGLLHRYTAHDDIVIGTPIANRNQPEVENLVGFFVNTVVLRGDISGDPTFKELLGRVRKTALDAYAHQNISFGKLVEVLKPERDLSRSPLFQVMMAWQETLPLFNEKKSDLKITSLEIPGKTAKFDLTLYCEETPQGFKGEFEYNTDLFEDVTIQRMKNHFLNFLSGIFNSPETKLSQLPLLTNQEQKTLLYDWNATHQPYPLEQNSLHSLFEMQVQKTPGATALVFENSRMTYRELNERSNQVAHYLISLGVKPETQVGVCLERSEEMMISLLGVLKAGAAYIPLDPSYPQKRLNEIIDESGIQIIIDKNFNWKSIKSFSTQNPVLPFSPQNGAYVIYTSGSTGTPKGVVNTHEGIVNRLLWMQETYQLTPEDKVMQKTPFTFDVSVWEFFWPLITGSILVLAKPEGHKDPYYLIEMIEKEKITTLHFVPSMLQAFLQAEGVESLASLKRVICSGEELPSELQKQFYKKLRSGLHNLYGPTEAAVDVTFWACKPEKKKYHIPIGKPIANIQIYLVDKYLQAVPVGVAGELMIGGIGLARGYLNRPDLTAEKFIPNPFSNKLGCRLYRTGDLAKYLPDGNIEFLGRIDHQIKIRGFRIELGEIEFVLLKNPSVREAVVLSHGDGVEKQLVSYVVLQKNQKPISGDLRGYLKEKLPEYMIPAFFIFLDQLPLTPNGKTDRKALPAPDGKRPDLMKEYVAPRNELEEKLVAIWKEVLGIEKIGVLDNFFDVGGHSLLATQVVSRVHTSFQIDLPLKSIFDFQTISELAPLIKECQSKGIAWKEKIISSVSRTEKIPLSFSQERLWFLDQLHAGSPEYNISYSAEISGLLDIPLLEKSLNKVIERHEVLRTNFTEQEGMAIQKILDSVSFKLQYVSLVNDPNPKNKLMEIFKIESQKPFNLSKDVLVRVLLVQTDQEHHAILAVVHHIVSDGWSMELFIKEVLEYYDSFRNNRLPALPKLPFQYVDYAVWQRTFLNTSKVREQINYWKKKLQNPPSSLDLPTDYPRPLRPSSHGEKVYFTIPTDLTENLKRLSRETNSTLFMTLLTAFKILLHRYSSGQEDILIGTPIANRQIQNTETLIGLFINTLVLRTDLSGNPTFKQLLERVRTTSLEAYSHQDLPFEKLVEELNPERNFNYNPLFQIMFVLQNMPQASLEIPDITLTSLDFDAGISQQDITVQLFETESEIEGTFEFRTSLFERTTIEKITDNFNALLKEIVYNPEKRISDFLILTYTDQKKLLDEWNPVDTLTYSRKNLIDIFEEQVEKHPKNVAIINEGQHWTYQELNTRANQLSRYLIKINQTKEIFIGLYLDRSLEMILAILGVLKAGATYIPIEPSIPQERFENILDDSQISIILTQCKYKDKITTNGKQIIFLDSDWMTISQEYSQNISCKICPEKEAYVIYTSGSTGAPKGVIVTHSNVVRLFESTRPWFSFDSKDVWTLFHSYAFDFSVWEIWGALLHGGKLVIVPFWISRSPDVFYELLCREEVTVLNQTPSAFYQLIDMKTSSESFKGHKLRFVIFGGEALDFKRLQPWMDCHEKEKPQLVNMYGITETTVHATYFPVTQKQEEFGGESLIGHPIPDLQIYLLDRYGNLVSPGIPGELHIGGAGLALGYLRRPELTSERFIPDPFSKKPGSRLYKSGDLARYLPDGNLEFLGRIDHQVKIRGFRVELGEIESALLQNPIVQQAVILTHGDGIEKYVIAYVVLQANQKSTSNDLRDFLKEKLPEYMIPSSFIFLDTLPLTFNGKLDRKALPSPQGLRPENMEEYVAPRNEIEKNLVAIWKEVLKIDRISIYDNFFQLGGHSLLAVQVLSRIRSQLNSQFSLKSLFENTTIAMISSAILNNKNNKEITKAIVPQADAWAELSEKINELSEKEVDNLLEEITRG